MFSCVLESCRKKVLTTRCKENNWDIWVRKRVKLVEVCVCICNSYMWEFLSSLKVYCFIFFRLEVCQYNWQTLANGMDWRNRNLYTAQAIKTEASGFCFPEIQERQTFGGCLQFLFFNILWLIWNILVPEGRIWPGLYSTQTGVWNIERSSWWSGTRGSILRLNS